LCEFNFVWCMKTNKECSIFPVAMFRTLSEPPSQGSPRLRTQILHTRQDSKLTSRLIFSVPFFYFIVIFQLPRCTLPDFPSVSLWLPCHFYRVVTTATPLTLSYTGVLCVLFAQKLLRIMKIILNENFTVFLLLHF